MFNIFSLLYIAFIVSTSNTNCHRNSRPSQDQLPISRLFRAWKITFFVTFQEQLEPQTTDSICHTTIFEVKQHVKSYFRGCKNIGLLLAFVAPTAAFSVLTASGNKWFFTNTPEWSPHWVWSDVSKYVSKWISKVKLRGRFTVHLGPTAWIKISSATVWNGFTTSLAVWGPSADIFRNMMSSCTEGSVAEVVRLPSGLSFPKKRLTIP